MAEVRSRDLVAALDEASLSRFHLRAVLVSGMGFFTDAYDLFIIGIASTLIAKEWHLSSGRLALTAQLSATFWPVLVPPWNVSPPRVRTFNVTSTPLKYWYQLP